MGYAFAYCNKARYIGCLSGWDIHSVSGIDCVKMAFARDDDCYIYDADSLNWNVPKYYWPEGTDPRNYRCEPAWRCLWFSNNFVATADNTKMFKGTSIPDASYPTDHEVYLSRKEHPLPYWYYHNDRFINELR